MKIKLEKLHNTRDLGGIRTSDGRVLKEKKIIRSGALYQATEQDLICLREDWDLKTVVDFRTASEIWEKPDPEIKGVQYIHNPIIRELAVGATHDRLSLESLKEFYEGDPVRKMERLYAELITDPWCVEHYRHFFRLLKEQKEGSLLYHCSAGKDRVGTGTCLFLSSLGVAKDQIIQDYLETNTHVAHLVRQLEQKVEAGELHPEMAELLYRYETVDQAYLEAVFRTAEEEYGGMEHFLTEILEADLGLLREKYLEA